MKMIIPVFLVFVAILLTSCSDKKEVLKGDWAIESIYYDSCNLKTSFSLNILTLFDQTCELPEMIYNDCELDFNLSETKGKYSIREIDNNFFFIIDTDNDLFNGRYSTKFYVDEKKKLFKLNLSSSHLKITMGKLFLDYDWSKREIDYWVKKT